MTARSSFIDQCGGVFEHSPWVAERAYDSGAVYDPLRCGAVHAALCAIFRQASRDERRDVLLAHPDLAGKLAIAGKLTDDSKAEQAGAGLDRLSADEHAEFTRLNEDYKTRFGFPFIIAVKGLGKDDILAAFKQRISNTQDEEFQTACEQVEKIARLRLEAILPE
ncbi:2-oxo-4-hydroxy-4-carboxy-5-ureidoimidazoline decarboxylase [Hoeflea prorocentri]|uniref:2-oxo-4-hydroxy-4-carboxy-5-ureidoimidazoline decarboxylase n=1 Tax=Hoeflea prorocentri TaxID=1922333 RepID=A0A9X3UJJ7_9HYPH|nr:2-oxo-4-hydroxy-4-carboxy-5-ureidoimidazoline decarboxylase [Hoeflea prorocentri]MCY6382028.1 2-oxo-4-hydroxy-4-carboxy-5-ureidoimidazoline decarboxylase [Hoeflea prorocentri]MDA5399828.1 2-oxo-4-hydroxy-4-carboxy-5-ureidoimidazoline decarboxylase [Hoeflea prorocentri]